MMPWVGGRNSHTIVPFSKVSVECRIENGRKAKEIIRLSSKNVEIHFLSGSNTYNEWKKDFLA